MLNIRLYPWQQHSPVIRQLLYPRGSSIPHGVRHQPGREQFKQLGPQVNGNQVLGQLAAARIQHRDGVRVVHQPRKQRDLLDVPAILRVEAVQAELQALLREVPRQEADRLGEDGPLEPLLLRGVAAQVLARVRRLRARHAQRMRQRVDHVQPHVDDEGLRPRMLQDLREDLAVVVREVVLEYC